MKTATGDVLSLCRDISQEVIELKTSVWIRTVMTALITLKVSLYAIAMSSSH